MSTPETPQDAPVTDPAPDSPQTPDLGAAEIQESYDVADEQGFFGVRSDPFSLSAHSLESGPDSPSVAETVAATAPAGTEVPA